MAGYERWILGAAIAGVMMSGCGKAPEVAQGGPATKEPAPIVHQEPTPSTKQPQEVAASPAKTGAVNKPAEGTPKAPNRPETAPPSRPPVAMRSAPRYTPPPKPKADETVSLSYKASDDNKIEVDGVCKITENNIGCWNPDGSADEDLAKRIKASLEKQQHLQGGGDYGPTISIRYGKKNRVVVFKMTQNVMQSSGANLMVESVGSNPFGGGGMYLSMDENESYSQSQPLRVHYETRTVTEDNSVTTTTARVRLSNRIMDQQTIDNRAGATAKFGGETVTILSIKKGIDQPMRMGIGSGTPESKRQAWTVTFKTTQTSGHPVQVSLSPLDASGQIIAYADEQGNPISQQEMQKRMQEEQAKAMERNRKNPGSGYIFSPNLSAMGYGMGRDGQTSLILYVDPAKVSKFQLSGSTAKFIDIKDIRLDPR